MDRISFLKPNIVDFLQYRFEKVFWYLIMLGFSTALKVIKFTGIKIAINTRTSHDP